MNIHADSLKSYRVTLCEAEDDGFLPEIIFECGRRCWLHAGSRRKTPTPTA